MAFADDDFWVADADLRELPRLRRHLRKVDQK